jgi:phosphatidylglycerophosphatase A
MVDHAGDDTVRVSNIPRQSDAPAPQRSDAVAMWLATGFGIGRLKPGPGTWGTALGCVLAPVLWQAGTAGSWAIVVGLAVIGVPVCSRAGKLMGCADPGAVVWDEIVAILVVALCLPHTLFGLLAGFVLFRFFDIAKPWPICHAERLPRGWGVMADDLVAAAASIGVFWLGTKLFGVV